MTPVGFKPTISADKRPQDYALGRVATGTDIMLNTLYKMIKYNNNNNNNNNNNELRHCHCYKVKFSRVLNSAFAKFV